MNNIQSKPIYMTSEIIVNSDGRILNSDKIFCEIFNCKSTEVTYNSVILDYIVEAFRPTVVNAFIDTFYGKHESKLYEIKMIDFEGVPLDVTIKFSPVRTSNGEKATLVIRKKGF